MTHRPYPRVVATPHEPERVLIAGDVHGNVSWFRHLCDVALEQGCDAVLQLGDFGFWPHVSTGRRFQDEASRHAARAGVVVYWIDGNHENHAQLRALARSGGFVAVADRCVYISRGHRWTWSGVRFGALGGAFSIDWRDRVPGTSWWPEEVTTDSDVELLGSAPLDVLVSHEAPAGIPLAGFPLPASDQVRTEEVRELIRAAVEATQPRLVLHGHWHRRYTYELTWTTAKDGGFEWRSTVVEGLAADVQRDVRAWGVLELDPLRFIGGETTASHRRREPQSTPFPHGTA